MNFVLLIIVNTFVAQSYGFECNVASIHCVTSLHIDYSFTMNSPKYGPLYTRDRKIYEENGDGEVPISEIISADGWTTPKQVLVANGSMPGPSIVINQNQTITIVVYNNLLHEAVTIHWHGIDQLGWPYMDGVAYVSQCPIMPGQSFNYTFQPVFGGTYWYHSHVGNQRDMGLYGAFIVLRKSDHVPFSKQFILELQEWNHLYNPIEILRAHKLKDHQPQAVLINGKGDYNNNMAPLEILNVNTSDVYKFRIIGVGSAKPLLFSVTGLKLNITETDGFEVIPIEVDQVIVYPAERYDFEIDFKYVPPGIYNIKVNILEGELLKTSDNAVGVALINVTNENDLSTRPSDENSFKVLNCPFDIYPNRSNVQCIPVSYLKSAQNIPETQFSVPSIGQTQKKITHFLNFGFPDDISSINGRMFVWPTVSAISQPKELDTSCSACSAEQTCKCTHAINLESGSEVTFVLLNLGKGMFISHPIHMHGHTYKVLKMGFPKTFADGPLITPTSDLKCSETLLNNQSHCSKAKWTNSSWNNVANIPGVNLENPVRKDTTVVPYGGYTVIQIKATNPGVWFMHCHIDPHMINGMALMLNESFDMIQSDPEYSVPSGFPICHSFLNTLSGNVQTLEIRSEETSTTSTNIGLIVAISVLGVFLFVITAIHIWYRRQNSGVTVNTGVELQTR